MAAARAPAAPAAQVSLCEALLAFGRADEAVALVQTLRVAQPLNQHLIALQATAWRMLGDARYGSLYDYGALVVPQTLAVPCGYTSLASFLDELAAELGELHSFHSHPLQQSVRGGSQLDLQAAEMARPLLGALFGSIAAAVHAYLARLGQGEDPLRSRNTGRAAFTGAWSVRLRSGGHHADHVHPHGWVSSACYIALPPTIGNGASTDGGQPDRAGWLRFGRPGIPTAPPLAAGHHVRPGAARLVLFPAYMWHGVEPFVGARPRLSVAFDVVPA